MSGKASRIDRDELIEIIKATEAAGRDASELRAALVSMPQANQRQKTGARYREEEEETTEARLQAKVGDLFSDGITDDVLSQLIKLDEKYSMKELRTMCKEAGLGVSGDKKELAAKLLASGSLKTKEVNVQQEKDFSLQREWIGEEGQSIDDLDLPEEYLKPVRYEVVVFARKERGGHDFCFYCKDYGYLPDHGWRFEHTIINTSMKEETGIVKQVRISYHPEIMLANVGFMVLPGFLSTENLSLLED